MKDLTNGSVGKLIMDFAIPIAVGMIFQLCYSFADVWIVGNTLGETALASVGATSTLNDLIVGFLIGLTNGFAVITARFFGAKDSRGMKKAISHTVMLGVLTSAILTVISVAFLEQILHFLNVSEELFEMAYSYARVILLFMSASMAYNICASILRAVGDTVTPLIFLIVSAVLNIILDIVFIKHIFKDVSGAAYATVISQFASAVLCFIYISIRYKELHPSKNDFRPSWEMTKGLMSCGLSMGLMSSLVAFGTVALQSSINTFGTSIIVAHTAARKLTSFFMMPFAVFGMTMSSYCAQNYGAGKYSRVREGVFCAVKYAWIWCIFLIVIVYTIVPTLLSLITSSSDPEIIQTGTKYLRINSILYFVTAVISIFRNSLQGIGEHKIPVISSGIELVGKVAVVMFLTPKIDYMGIIVSEPIVWVLMVIPLIVRLLSHPAMKKPTAE